MATLLIDKVNERIPALYETASETEKQQIRQVIEDIFRLLTWRQHINAADQLHYKASEAEDKLARLDAHPECLNGDPEEIVHLDWSGEGHNDLP